MEIELRCLKCTKELPSYPSLEVGDRVYRVRTEIADGGYEYAVCRRVDDGMTVRFRVDHLEDCFDEDTVTVSGWSWLDGDDDED